MEKQQPRHRKGPLTKSEKARKLNREMFGRETDLTERPSDCVKYKRGLPPIQREFHTVEAHICHEMEIDARKNGETITEGVSPLRLGVVRKLKDIALRDTLEDVETVRCPICKKPHTIICPKCGPHLIAMPNAQLEKNQITALCKFSDKFVASKAAISKDVDLSVVMEKIAAKSMMGITEFVPSDKLEDAKKRFMELFKEGMKAYAEER